MTSLAVTGQLALTKYDILITAKRIVKLRELVQVSHGRTYNIVQSFSYSKNCARFQNVVSRMLAESMNTLKIVLSQNFCRCIAWIQMKTD